MARRFRALFKSGLSNLSNAGSRSRNIAYLLYRLVSPVIDPIRSARALAAYPWYLATARKYGQMQNREEMRLTDSIPILFDRIRSTPFDSHYFYQDNWFVRQLYLNRPETHVDIGSRVDTVGHITAFTRAVFVDLRPLEAKWDNLECVSGDLLNLPFQDSSIDSLSCLHVAEHVGLGRYGDTLDPEGTRKSTRELARVLAPGGNLYFSLPVGRARLCFNAHRIHSPRTILGYFDELELVEMSGVTDSVGAKAGRFIKNVPIDVLEDSDYACGLFWFRRRRNDQ